MLVGRRMKREPVTITRTESLAEARRRLDRHRIRHLPVVEADRVVGILTDRDIRQAAPSSLAAVAPAAAETFLERIRVEEAMARTVRTVSPFTPIEEAARLMQDNKIGCLPVTEGDRLVGIITETDILGVLVEVMGVREPSSRLELVLPDRPGVLADVTRIIKDRQVNITSVLTLPGPEAAKRTVIIRIKTMNPEPVRKDLEQAGYPATLPPR